MSSDGISQYDTYISGYTTIEQLLADHPLIESEIFHAKGRVIWDMTGLTSSQQSPIIHFLRRSREESIQDLVLKGVNNNVGASAVRLEIYDSASNLDNSYRLTDPVAGSGVYALVDTLVYHGPNVTKVSYGFLKHGPTLLMVENMYLDFPKLTGFNSLCGLAEAAESSDTGAKK